MASAASKSSLEASVVLASKLVAYEKTLTDAEIHITPCVTPYGVRGGCASKRIPKGGLIARIPKADLWSHDTLSAGDVGKAFVDITKKMGRTDFHKFCPLVAYHLLHELELGARSKWALQVKHIATSTNDSALMWTKERLLEDYGMDLYKETGDYVADVLATHREIRDMLKSSSMPSLLKYSFSDYLWAYSKCTSRAWSNKLNGEPFMAPGAADILNSGKSGMVLSEMNSKGDFVYTAGVDFEKGQELEYYYQETEDVYQLLAYGYLPKKI